MKVLQGRTRVSEHFVVGAITDNCAVSGETDGELASPSTNSVSEVYTPAVSGDPESTTPPSRSSDCDGRRDVWDFYPTGVLDPALADSARSPSASEVNDMLGLGLEDAEMEVTVPTASPAVPHTDEADAGEHTVHPETSIPLVDMIVDEVPRTIQPECHDTAASMAVDEGERRNLLYIIYRACRAIGQDVPYPALLTVDEDNAGVGDEVTVPAVDGAVTKKRGIPNTRRHSTKKRVSSAVVKPPPKKISTRTQGSSSANGSSFRKRSPALPQGGSGEMQVPRGPDAELQSAPSDGQADGLRRSRRAPKPIDDSRRM